MADPRGFLRHPREVAERLWRRMDELGAHPFTPEGGD